MNLKTNLMNVIVTFATLHKIFFFYIAFLFNWNMKYVHKAVRQSQYFFFPSDVEKQDQR